MFIERSKGYGCQLEEYQGKWSIASGHTDKDGKVWLEFARFKHWDKDKRCFENDDKDKPNKITLGDKEQAVAALKLMLAEIEPF